MDTITISRIIKQEYSKIDLNNGLNSYITIKQ